ncbi:DUF488 domain-containing protein [Arthrobacter oryzae]|uniref:DUF488 domain-containing protein n=1 Tax=Arthrobacter oryzae TaxID=409290 RepID=UPI00273BBD2F|nr:DUF488 domain-containing protein [Arthrobacter oryzae]WLQ07335.1 DUF488 domain-containing protein [Arthrobacter oryzae]
MTDMTIFTVGHSTHPIGEFIGILKAHGIRKLIDVRTVPKSRHNPQFNGDALAASLRASGITYRRMESLGGLRHARKDSPNGAWRNESFRGYADYMQTEEFSTAIDKLVERGRTSNAAIMCAEAVPWRCHRSLIGDALLVRNIEVLDIMTEKSAKPHTLTSFARVDGNRVWYPAS